MHFHTDLLHACTQTHALRHTLAHTDIYRHVHKHLPAQMPALTLQAAHASPADHLPQSHATLPPQAPCLRTALCKLGRNEPGGEAGHQDNWSHLSHPDCPWCVRSIKREPRDPLTSTQSTAGPRALAGSRGIGSEIPGQVLIPPPQQGAGPESHVSPRLSGVSESRWARTLAP